MVVMGIWRVLKLTHIGITVVTWLDGMLPITLIILLIDVMPTFLLSYQLKYLHHNYSIQYLKLVSFLIGTMPSDSVITCLCEFWQSAIEQCYLQKKKSCLFVCLCILYAWKQKLIYILLCQAHYTCRLFWGLNMEKKNGQIFQGIFFFFFKYFLNWTCFYFLLLKVIPPPGLMDSFIWHMRRYCLPHNKLVPLGFLFLNLSHVN